MKFNFDEAWTNLDSSLIKGIWHNADNKQMLVRLDGGKQYVYNNVERVTADVIGKASSAGRAYNVFRNGRANNQSGSYAHDYQPVAKAASVTIAAQPAYGSAAMTAGNITQAFSVTYLLEGKQHTSTVNARDVIEAATDVNHKLTSLGFQAKLTGVAVK